MQKSITTKKRSTKRTVPDFKDGAEFDALSDNEKERVWESYNRSIPLSETRSLRRKEREQHLRAVRRGRKPVGKGASRINVTIERGLLERADAFAETHSLSRAALISRGLEMALGGGRGTKRNGTAR